MKTVSVYRPKSEYPDIPCDSTRLSPVTRNLYRERCQVKDGQNERKGERSRWSLLKYPPNSDGFFWDVLEVVFVTVPHFDTRDFGRLDDAKRGGDDWGVQFAWERPLSPSA